MKYTFNDRERLFSILNCQNTLIKISYFLSRKQYKVYQFYRRDVLNSFTFNSNTTVNVIFGVINRFKKFMLYINKDTKILDFLHYYLKKVVKRDFFIYETA